MRATATQALRGRRPASIYAGPDYYFFDSAFAPVMAVILADRLARGELPEAGDMIRAR